MVKFLKNSPVFSSALLLLILLISYIVLYKIYIPKINAFGCFDDCFNYVAGYFIFKGKTLYSEIPFNHQLLPAYISYLVQAVTHPINIFELVLKHRQFVLLFGFSFNVLLVLRFKWVGLGFALLYEFSKFYLFGDRFLAEGMIVYPIVYTAGLLWLKLEKKDIFKFEYILAGLFAWFVIFSREPYVPLALFLYALLLFGKPYKKIKIISVVVFLSLTAFTLLSTPINEYIYNVFTINTSQANQGLLNGEILRSFYYPVFILFGGKWGIFRYYLVGLDLIFLGLFFYLLLWKRKIKLCLAVFLTLVLANLRANNVAGVVYFEAFHMISWFGLLVMFTLLMLKQIFTEKKRLGFLILILLAFLFTKTILSSQSYIYDKINSHEEFITNFGTYLQVGEVVKSLSEPEDTLFLDGFDDLITWQADRLSSYKYAWYVAFMMGIPEFDKLRVEMFKNNPPDFYYGSCPKEINPARLIPEGARSNYIRLNSLGNPTCLFVKKSKAKEISQKRWQKAKEFLYEFPSD